MSVNPVLLRICYGLLKFACLLTGGILAFVSFIFLFGWILKMGVWKLTGVAGPILGSAAGAALCFWLAHFVDRSIVSKR